MTGPGTADLAELGSRLGAALLQDRKLILGVGPLAGVTRHVEMLRQHGARRPLVLARSLGTGPLPDPADADITMLDLPVAATLSADLRLEVRYLQDPPPAVTSAVEAYDPERAARWWVAPYVGLAEVGGRAVLGPRRAEWVALEDKTVIDGVFDACGVARPPSVVTAARREDPVRAAAATDAGGGTVWSGDAHAGMNGGAELVRWVRDPREARVAAADLAAVCQRVRVAPFVEGVPCSIHGIVLPDGVAALRPVELLTLRDAGGRFFYSGMASWWDPPHDDREAMRSAARRVGAELGRRVGFRGGFSVDGILSADGWVPTEVNTRFSGGLSMLSRGIPDLPLQLLQVALVEGVDTGARCGDLEDLLVGAADAHRTTASHAFTRTAPDDGEAEATTPDGTVVFGPSLIGGLVRLLPASDALRPGDRVAPLSARALAVADERWGTGFGPCTPAVDVR